MRVIITHEQADFDAIASLLGAYLLDESAYPVLPNRLNRNVRAFITLYGVELPFVERRDLPSDSVEMISLVDSQSLVSVKGAGPETPVQVVDHHQLREDLPTHWTATIEDIGATATLFVEALQERNGILNPIHATLFLLGIYEDTGSLTYSRTSARDLRAAASLIEQGASLRIAADFLNHPLSTEQQELYDQLRASAETYSIHGHTIVIASGDAQELEEELSSIAHKLRDLLDPDALFLLLTTHGGIQFIARSTTDNIDVAEIASRFGGGGHPRASAGLIRERKLREVIEQLKGILHEDVQPAIVVAQIMSRTPQVLAPDTPVEEAAERMRRYGYEGYPVVERGKVVGLLTRRAVDRALSHKLNLSAASLMEAGEVAIQPDDPLDKLQRLMTDTGWGQIPVVHPETGSIIGIVTRTDLLKTFTHESRVPSRQSMAARLDSALPPARLALLKCVARLAHKQRAAFYVVGGFVRDLLLDRPSLDFDLVVEGDAIALARALSRQYGGRVTGHTRFGTAKWFIADIREDLARTLAKENLPTLPGTPQDLPETLDLITARVEFYTHPTALPTVESGSIKLDLHRRDFTVNTLALRLDGRHYGDLHDYWGGYNDLRQGLVRVLHSLSFIDDPTRIVRAVRFEQRFNFQIEERTLHLLKEALQLLDRVSGTRIRHELDHVLEEEMAPHMLARLEELEVSKAIHPELVWDDWLISRLEALTSPKPGIEWDLPAELTDLEVKRALAYTLWLIRLPAERALHVLKRLNFPSRQAGEILAAISLRQELAGIVSSPPSVIATRLDEAPPMALYATFISLDEEDLRSKLHKYATSWRYVTPTISGHDLRARGLPPGPIYRQILAALRSAWLDGIISTLEEEQEMVNLLISEQSIMDKG